MSYYREKPLLGEEVPVNYFGGPHFRLFGRIVNYITESQVQFKLSKNIKTVPDDTTLHFLKQANGKLILIPDLMKTDVNPYEPITFIGLYNLFADYVYETSVVNDSSSPSPYRIQRALQKIEDSKIINRRQVIDYMISYGDKHQFKGIKPGWRFFQIIETSNLKKTMELLQNDGADFPNTMELVMALLLTGIGWKNGPDSLWVASDEDPDTPYVTKSNQGLGLRHPSMVAENENFNIMFFPRI